MTSYAMIMVLAATSILYLVVRGPDARLGPWPFALFAAAATVLWLVLVASKTVGYLEPVFSHAVSDTFHTVSGESAPRKLFRSNSGQVAPVEDRILGIVSVLLLVTGLPFGLRVVWRRYRRNPLILMLAIAAVAYVGTLGLRAVPGAWETASRASEFLFIGVALVLALGGFERWGVWRAPWFGRVALCAAAVVLVSGGFVAGWQPSLRIAQTYRIDSDGHAIDPPGVSAARWSGRSLGGSNRIGAENGDARLFQLYGRQVALAGTYPDVQDLLHSPALDPWEPGFIQKWRFRYLAVDRREISADPLAAYFFPRPGQWNSGLRNPDAVAKFDRDARTERLYDNGEIVVYDVSRVGR
jgi:hypothetical protein